MLYYRTVLGNIDSVSIVSRVVDMENDELTV
jgi:hypothetical protein